MRRVELVIMVVIISVIAVLGIFGNPVSDVLPSSYGVTAEIGI